jgi:hypothetical protein
MKLVPFACVLAVTLICSEVLAVSLYIGRGAGSVGSINQVHYYYGGSQWPEMTATIDAGFDTITVAPALTDLDAMLAHDRLWVDSRAFFGANLSAVEIDNIQTFIATGRRAVLMGERGEVWSTQILSIVGGTWAGEGRADGGNERVNALPIVPALTGGVGSMDFRQNGFGQSLGGTPLFDRPWSALWGTNALTVLDVVVFNQWYDSSHAQYGRNVVQWLAIPEPSTTHLVELAIVVVAILLGRRSVYSSRLPAPNSAAIRHRRSAPAHQALGRWI